MSPHVDDNEIALFLEGETDASANRRVTVHLQGCDRCRRVVLDAARVVGAFQIDPTVFDSAPGLAVADGDDRSTAAGSRSATGMDWKRRFKGLFGHRPRLVAAAIAVLVAGGVWIGLSRQGDDPAYNPRILAPVRAAIETASSNGFIIIPGGEQHLRPRAATYRTGHVDAGDSLQASLASLQRLFESDVSDRVVAYWLIAGYVATGQTDLARTLAGEARSNHPSDSEILGLYALTLYQDGDSEAAEELYGEILELYPDDPVALINSSLVLIDLNKTADAEARLERVRSRHKDTPYESRVELIRTTLIEE